MRVVIRLLYWLYALVFIVSGVVGVFGAREEMRLMFSMDADAVGATLLSQYRFLRAAEAGFGVSMLLYRRDVFTTSRHTAAFLLVCFLLPFSRSVSLFMDGWPSFFGMLMVVEYGLFVLFALHARRTVWSPRPKDAGEERAG